MKKLLLLAVLILKVSLYAFANIGHPASLTLDEFTANAATASNALSSNANLANLTVNGHALSPAFSSSTLQYVVSVDSSETLVYFTPTVADAQAKITVDGQAATSGTMRSYFTNVGDNLVQIVVKASDGTTKTYSIIFKRKISSDNTLMSLSLSSASISPAFNKNVLNYTATVASDIHKTSLSFNPSASKGTTKVNGVFADHGALVTLNPGNNTFNIEVTAENGAVRTYVLIITRPAENNAYLAGLSILPGPVLAFSAQNYNYTTFVSNDVSSVSVVATLSNAWATVKVNGKTVSSGGYSETIFISVGANTITVTVTAEDGVTVHTYTVIVNRAKPGLLSNLTLSTGTLPGFNRNLSNYNVSVESTVASVTVTATAADAGTVITVNGVAATSGAASQAITLQRGLNTITIQATDAFGYVQTYIVNVTQQKSTDANLSNLTISQGTLSPAFNTNTITYNVVVPSSVTSVTVVPTRRTGVEQIRVNGVIVASGSTSQAIGLSLGDNTFTVVSGSEAGNTKVYTITVTRVRSEVLSGLTVSAGTLSGAFNPISTYYNVAVTDSVSSITVLPVLTSAAASVKVNGVTVANGNPSAAIPLQLGSNTITVAVQGKVTDDSRTYTITVSRIPDLRLDNLVISDGTLTPAFNKDILTYKVTVPYSTSSMTFTATPHYPGATMKLNGASLASGVPSAPRNLSVSEDGQFIQVSAAGVTKTYTVNVKRLPPLLLSGMFISAGTLTQVGTTDNYTVSVSNSVTSVTMKVGTQDPATIKVNGNITAQNTNSTPITLTGTSTTFLVELLGTDGINKRIFSITVNRAGSNSTAINYIAVNTGPITKVNVKDWESTVLFNVASVNVTLGTKDPATIKINGVVTAQLTASVPVTLTGVTTTIPVEITAEDGVTKLSFNIIIHRPPPSSNTALGGMLISAGTLIRVGTTDNYTASVSTSVSSVTLKVSTTDPTTIKINGIITAQSAISAPITLTGATTTFPVEITAQDGITKRNISITVKKAGSNNTALNYIAVNTGPITRVDATANWESTVLFAVTSVKITLGTKDPATIKVNGVTTAQLTASAPVTLTGSTTVIPIEITAEDGVTKLLFNITIHKAPPSNGTGLKFIAVSTGPVTKVGASLNWVSLASSSVSSVQITLATKDPATIKINGISTAQNTASAPVTLTGTATAIPVEITAEDGVTKQTFTITINRTGSNSTWLSDMSISAGTLTQVGTTDNYTASVSSSVSSVTMKVGTKSPATIKINGVSTAQNTASSPITLTGAATTFPVEITAEDGTTKRNISITVNKTGSNNTALNYIAVNAGPITRVGTTNNWVSTVKSTVSSVKVTLRTKDPATIKINGVTTAQFTESAPITLTGAATAIAVEIKAEDGVTTLAFTITINKTPPPGIASVNKNAIDVLQKQEPSPDAVPEALTVKQAVSPNGDGINDRLTIAGINAYPENTVRIMNRNGDVIYEAKGYDNESKAFDGRSSKGTLQQPGTYFYSIEYKKGTETLRKTGYMVLKY
jgi:gliding motility-associated-like protein